jgi:hypothetical protein
MSKASPSRGGVHDRSRKPVGAAAHRAATAQDGSGSAATGMVSSAEPQSREGPGTPRGGGLDPRSTPEDAEGSILAAVERHERRRAELVAAGRAACAPAAQPDFEPAAPPEPGQPDEPKRLDDDAVDLAIAAVVEHLAETLAAPAEPAPTEPQPAPPAEPSPGVEPEPKAAAPTPAAEPARGPTPPAPATAPPAASTAPPPAAEPDPSRAIYPDQRLPIERYLQEAIEAEFEWINGPATESGADASGDARWKSGFRFVRLCRAHRDLAELEALRALGRVQDLVRLRRGPRETLHRLFGELAGLFDCEAVDLPARWLNSWTKVRVIPGEPPILHAVRLANHFRLEPQHHATGLPGYPRLFSIVGWMSWVLRDKPMCLAVRTLAPHVPCSPRTVGTYLGEMQKTGALRLVKRYPLSSGKAWEYEFLLRDRYKWLVDGPPA